MHPRKDNRPNSNMLALRVEVLALILGVNYLLAAEGLRLALPLTDGVDRNVEDYDDDIEWDEIEADAIGNHTHQDALLTKQANPSGESRWPFGNINYSFQAGMTNQQMLLILEAMAHIESLTCVIFQYVGQTHPNRIEIKASQQNCRSVVGYRPGVRYMKLGPKCFQRGLILHELLHVLGFYHQHSSPDRDNYIRILFENIQDWSVRFFRIVPDITDFGVGYDYGSILHYGNKIFSKNHQPTIIPLDSNAVIGQRDDLSPKDIEKINLMYKCSKFVTNQPSP